MAHHIVSYFDCIHSSYSVMCGYQRSRHRFASHGNAVGVAVMLKDASNANNANSGYVAIGKIKRSKAVVRVVCVRTTLTTLTTADKAEATDCVTHAERC